MLRSVICENRFDVQETESSCKSKGFKLAGGIYLGPRDGVSLKSRGVLL